MKKEKNIYDILERLRELKLERESHIDGDICPVYSPPQKCVESRCIWFDVRDRECWVLNPKPEIPG